jgi:bifunctional DNA-binding transcriptional regulator/antitoxin component of YhaV-PrlF toxin-antitoxin module
MERIKLNSDYTIVLPEKLRKVIERDAEFIVTLNNDEIRLKKIRKSLLDKAAEIEDDTQPSSEEINRIIHEVRQNKNESSL